VAREGHEGSEGGKWFSFANFVVFARHFSTDTPPNFETGFTMH
jgi:hypothetical protein